MKFCPSCKSVLVPKNGRLVCSCGYSEKGNITLKENVEKPREIEVIDEENEHIGETETDITCWNCGAKKVYFWMVQMRRADEPPTRFYRCRKCKKVWRSGK